MLIVKPGVAPALVKVTETTLLPPAKPPRVSPESTIVKPPDEWWSAWDGVNREFWLGIPPARRQAYIDTHREFTTCKRCGRENVYVPSPCLDGILKGYIHAHCNCRREELTPAQPVRRARSWWEEHCPDEFKVPVNVNMLADLDAFNRVLRFDGTKGMFIHGGSGRSKTRAVWTLFMTLDTLGKSIYAIHAEEWGRTCSRLMVESQTAHHEWLDDQRYADVLFIDDLDKITLTERVCNTFVSLFTARTSEHRPTIFTTQLLDSELVTMFAEKREIENGTALVRRIQEFCEDIGFE